MQLSLITATHFRAHILQTIALPSLQHQSDCHFEWVVINDGADAATRERIAQVRAQFAIRYVEMEHPTSGFGLCHARNLGLAVATGEWVAYLDDDNSIHPQFVAATRQFFATHPTLQCSMVQQMRCRQVVKDGQVKRSGPSFVSPQAGTTLTALIRPLAD